MSRRRRRRCRGRDRPRRAGAGDRGDAGLRGAGRAGGARTPAAPRPGGPGGTGRGAQGLPGSRRRVPRRAEPRSAATAGSVHQPVRAIARSLARPGPSYSGARVGHRASRGPHTRAAARRRPAPPRPRPCAARPRPRPRPTCSAPPPAAPKGAPPSSQHVMTQDAVTPCLSHPAEVPGLGRSSPGTCFPACKGV